MIGLLSSDEYYERLSPGQVLEQLYRIGQFFWAPSLFLFGERQPFLVRSTYSRNFNDYEYRIEQMRQEGEFNTPLEPNQALGIRSDERAVIIGAKRRPVVLISRPISEWTDRGRRGDDCFLVAPVYSFGRDETRLAYSQSFIERVKAYLYWQLFYLPGNNRSQIREGFIRLDRLQVVHKRMLEHMPVMLSDETQSIMRAWTRVYLGEELDAVDDVLFEYREQAITNLRDHGLIP